jgi:hypothetical protein
MKKFIFISLLVLSACQSNKKSQESALGSLLNQQAALLVQVSVRKTSSVDGTTETAVVKNLNWNNELEIFRQADILKGSLRYRYKYAKPAPNQGIFTTTESTERLPVKSFKITYGKDTTEIKDIEIVIRKKNYIYESERTLQMTFDKNEKGNLQIKSYNIFGRKNLIFTSPTLFSIKGEVL